MTEPKDNQVPIWYFIGLLLVVYGVLITGAGIYQLLNPPEVKTVLFELHAGIWWGALLLLLGLVYVFKFRPGRAGA